MQRQRDELASLQKQVANVGILFGPTDRGTSEQGLLLQELLAANPRVALTGLKTVPTTVFFSPANEAMGNKTGKGTPELKSIIYRSGIEVSLKGSFPDLLTYLQSLERRSDRLFWSNARLDVTAYPESILKLDISALGEVASAPLN
jgi:MSHA biogenesis protein MshJ